jgi:hypothetical protein
MGYSEELIEFNIEPDELIEADPELVAEPVAEPVAKAKQVEFDLEPAAIGQVNTIWWTLGIIAVATLAGGGFLLLRRSGN